MTETTTATPQLDRIAAHGNRAPLGDLGETLSWTGDKTNNITCGDGFKLSVIAGGATYCSPRPTGYPLGDAPNGYSGPYHNVEVGFPSERPEPWDNGWSEYADDLEKPTETVYGYVPVETVRALILAHGGEVTR
jgi:hypothetical protein